MMERIIQVGPQIPDRVIARCRELIGSGGIIVYPTDTFYALGADPRNEAAVRRLFRIKGRQEDQPILLLLADRADVDTWASSVNAKARGFMDRFWPGALTIVLSARTDVAPALTGGSGRIGLRIPGSSLTRSLITGVGTALTGTSANRTGGRSPLSAQAVLDDLGEDVDLILDSGPAKGDKPSTVIDASREEPMIIRHGAVDVELMQ